MNSSVRWRAYVNPYAGISIAGSFIDRQEGHQPVVRKVPLGARLAAGTVAHDRANATKSRRAPL